MKSVEKTCKGCVYFDACGSTTRTEPCKGRRVFDTKMQRKIWNVLCKLDGAKVAELFIIYFGDKILDEDFKEHLEEEGVM